MADIEEKATEEIIGLTLLEAQELKIILKDEYGIEPAAGGAVMIAGPASAIGAEAEQAEFDVVLTSAGSSKINVINEVRGVTGLGLKAAKELVEAGNQTVRGGVSKAEAEEIKARLIAKGATVEISGYIAEQDYDDYSNTLAWAAADWLALGSYAKMRSESLDSTLKYVQRVCQKVQKA